MAGAFTVADQGDGTVTWTLSGTGGAAWTVYQAAHDGILTGSYSIVTTGTGDGFTNQSITAGHYFTYAVIDGTPLAPKYYRATDGTKSVFEQILDAVLARIKTAALADIAESSVVLRKRPWDRNITKPAVIVSPAPETRNHEGGSNLLDETGYGCLVTIWQASNENLTSELGRHLLWRQDVVRAFENQVALTSIPEVLSCAVDPGAVLLPEEFTDGFDVQTVMIRAQAREPRGIN